MKSPRVNATSHQWIYSLSLLLALAVAAVAGSKDQTLDIYWVDVEGGGGTLIVTPAGEAIEVDSGVPGDRDAGRIHRVVTQAAGLDHLDHLVTTHFDMDHYGGAPNLARLLPIRELWDNGIPTKDPGGRDDARFLERMKPYREMNVGQRHIIAPGDLLPLKQSDNQLFGSEAIPYGPSSSSNARGVFRMGREFGAENTSLSGSVNPRTVIHSLSRGAGRCGNNADMARLASSRLMRLEFGWFDSWGFMQMRGFD